MEQWFDENGEPLGWFDESADPGGWFAPEAAEGEASVVGQGGDETLAGTLRQIDAQVVVEACAVERVCRVEEGEHAAVLLVVELPCGVHAHHGSRG